MGNLEVEIAWDVIKEEAEVDDDVWRLVGELLAREDIEVVWSVLEAMFETDPGLKEAILEKLGCVEREVDWDEW